MFEFLSPDKAPLQLIMAFFAITFLQSAVDKTVDFKGNLDFLNGHFKNSPLAGQVKPMLMFLTLVEYTSGVSCVYAIFQLIFASAIGPTHMALTICGLNLVMLLFGQRLAKDYAGASTIGIYMILVMSGFILI